MKDAVKIDLSVVDLEPTPVCTQKFPKGGLQGRIQIGSGMFRVEAYQVEEDQTGHVKPVLPEHQDELEAMFELWGESSIGLQKIGDEDYVIGVYPLG